MATTPSARSISALELALEGDARRPCQPRRALQELEPAIEMHERPEHQQRRMRDAGIGLVGAQHPVDQRLAVAAAAGGNQNVGLIR